MKIKIMVGWILLVLITVVHAQFRSSVNGPNIPIQTDATSGAYLILNQGSTNFQINIPSFPGVLNGLNPDPFDTVANVDSKLNSVSNATVEVVNELIIESLASFSAKTVFLSTNEHPTMAETASLLDEEPPEAQIQQVVISANDTPVSAGPWYYVNGLSFVPSGKYFSSLYVSTIGNHINLAVTVSLVWTNTETLTGGVLDTSAAEPIPNSTPRHYRLPTYTSTSLSHTNPTIYVGILAEFEKTGGATTTALLYMGTPYDTHLETPGIGQPEGVVTPAELLAALQNNFTNGIVFPQLNEIPTWFPAGSATETNITQLNILGRIYFMSSNYVDGGYMKQNPVDGTWSAYTP